MTWRQKLGDFFTIERLVLWACLLALLALGLMVWPHVQPTPLTIMASMSLGQAIGTLSLLLYLGALLLDLRRAGVLKRKSESQPPPPTA